MKLHIQIATIAILIIIFTTVRYYSYKEVTIEPAVVVEEPSAIMVEELPAIAGEVVININIIISIESGGNSNAINYVSQAYGLMQVTPPVVIEYNKEHGTNYRIEDMLLPVLCYNVGSWYLNHRIPYLIEYYDMKDTVLNRIIAYNWGIGNLLNWYKGGSLIQELPAETLSYYKKYLSRLG